MTEFIRALRGCRYRYRKLSECQKLYPYMISVIIAVYNTGEYLTQMLESILSQKQDVLSNYLRKNSDVHCKTHVYEDIYEVILVDDGSDCYTASICDAYAAQYPWINVVHKKNEGTSSAKNIGINLARGKYITFPDSDDILGKNVFESCFLFFEQHNYDVSIVTYPLTFFDAQSGDHWTTYRFDKGTRVLDMHLEWDKPQYFTAASFFLTDDLKNKIYFHTELINGEDMVLANEVILKNKPHIGLISDCKYYYRRRSSNNKSAIQSSKYTPDYYLPYIENVLSYIIKMALNKYRKLPKYIQYTIMGQLQFRLMSDGSGDIAKSVIGTEGVKEYKTAIRQLLKLIDIDVIISQKCLSHEHIFYACMAHTNNQYETFFNDATHDLIYRFDGQDCVYANDCPIILNSLSIEKDCLSIDGKISNLNNNFNSWILVNDVRYDLSIHNDNYDIKILGTTALFVRPFSVKVTLTSAWTDLVISFWSNIENHNVLHKKINFGKSIFPDRKI